MSVRSTRQLVPAGAVQDCSLFSGLAGDGCRLPEHGAAEELSRHRAQACATALLMH